MVNSSVAQMRHVFIVFALLLAVIAPNIAHGETVPLSVRRVVIQAQQLLAKKDYVAALAVLEPQAHQPHHYLIDFTLGNLYLLSARQQQAIPYYQAVLLKRPEHAASWLNLAQCYYATAQYLKAGEAFACSYRYRRPLKPQLLYNGALSYLRGAQPQQALILLKQLLTDFPTAIAADWRAALVQVYWQLKQPQQAIAQLEILAEHTTGEQQRHWRELLVQQYINSEMNSKALAAVQNYLNDDGLSLRWWQLLTQLHLDAGKQSAALVALKVMAYLHPLNETQMRLLADLYLRLGVPEQAIYYYKQLHQQHHDDADLLLRLAYASLSLHKPQQALFWAQQGRVTMGDSVDSASITKRTIDLLQLQAQLLFSLKRYPEAVTKFGQVAKILTQAGKDSGAAWLMQGYAAWNGELWQQARQALLKAKQYPAQRQRATQLLQQLKGLD